MDERACLQRQQVRTRIGTVPTAMAQCAGCEQGREVRLRLEATGRLAEVLTRIEEGHAWHARRSAQAMKARRRSPESAAPAARVIPPSPAPPPAAAVVHPQDPKEKPMAEKRKCVTCKKSTLRSNSVGDECFQCRLAKSKAGSSSPSRPVAQAAAPVQALPTRPAVAADLRAFYAGLTVAQLRAHHEALKADAGRRIREADELKEIAPTAFAAQLEVA
jgi:hypothetical protein